MDPDSEILLDCSPMFRQYKSGRVERLFGTETVPASVDHATGVTSKDVTIDADRNISARLYLPKLIESPSAAKLPILIYIHGGGFTNGSAFNPNPFLLSLVAKSSILAVSVDYRLAPENLLPAAYDDCWDTYMWVMSHASGTGPEVWLIEQADFNHVFLFGESAGANIAHNMGMRAGMETVKFDGIILGHPYFWGTEPVGSEVTDPSVRGKIEGLWKVVNKEGVSVDDPTVNPMATGAPSLAGLGCQRVMVCVAEKDVLAERGRAYYEALKRSCWGGEVEMVEAEEEDHVFFYMKPECDKALDLLAKIDNFVKRTKKLTNNVHIKGLVLIHPYFLENEITESDAFNPRMSSGLKKLWWIVCPSTTGFNDHRINPMAEGAPSLKNIGCNNVLVCVAGNDALRDRGRAYYEKLKESGFKGKLELFEAEGEGHVFHVYTPTSVQALAQDKRMCNFINPQ